MAMLEYKTADGTLKQLPLPFDFPTDWGNYLEAIMADIGKATNITIIGASFIGQKAVALFEDLRFVKCAFEQNCFKYCRFVGTVFEDCSFSLNEVWFEQDGIKIYQNGKLVKEKTVTNDTIAKVVKGKVISLPNYKFVKVMCTCDFCHKTFAQIQPRSKPMFFMKPVPNCDKIVCDKCYKDYALYYKDVDHRTYGYRGSLSFYRTPMDKKNTAILGLEMEFEGDFTGWKELEDAHKGALHYGYDSSVRGKNELSWDCGSYSWWKYLSPLKETCKALKAGGAEEGPTAGIHIHVSRPDIANEGVASVLNTSAKKSHELRIAMIAVSLRKDIARMNTYASFTADYENHHAAISASRHGTVEFRIFASSLDPNIILKRLLLCKTWFNLAVNGARGKELLTQLPKHLKQFILDCAKEQVKDGVLSDSDMDALTKTLN